MPTTIQPSDYYTCRDCKQVKPAEEFIKSSTSFRGRTNFCKPCTQIKNKRYIKNNPEKRARSAREYNLRLKALVHKEYGGFCACCGETEESFLTIDHINGDGAEHRKTVRPGPQLYRQMQNEGFPKDKYQLLCYNCNWSKGPGKDGKCIHQRKVQQMFYDEQQAALPATGWVEPQLTKF